MSDSMLQIAGSYAMGGLHVFPCEKKKPLTPHGFKDASRSALRIAEWWSEYPNAQIGIPTGKINGLFAVDLDGAEAVEAAKKLNLPETFTVQTRENHFHCWYLLPDGAPSKNTTSVLGPHIDTRGEGGYVIAPGSIHHETGEPYKVVKDIHPWTPAPIELLNPGKQSGSPTQNGADTIPQGHRHQTMLSLAGSLRARHLSPDAVLAQLRIANENLCKPPLDDTDIVKLASYVGSKPPGFAGQRPTQTSAEVGVEYFDQVQTRPVHWLWPKRIPLGKLTIFAGDPGHGKSLVTLDIAARLSQGGTFPDGSKVEMGGTLILSAEDDPEDTIKPRLEEASADVSKIGHITAVKVILADGTTGKSFFSLDRDLEKLEDVLVKNPTIRMLVVDPVSAYMGKVDSYKDAEIRRVLSPLAEVAARRRIAVIGIMHLNKGADMRALMRISGSIGYVAAARAVWAFGVDPENPNIHLMVSVKINNAKLGSGLAYRIEGPADGIPHIEWEPGDVFLNANDVLAETLKRKGGGAAADVRQERQARVELYRQWIEENPHLTSPQAVAKFKARGIDVSASAIRNYKNEVVG